MARVAVVWLVAFVTSAVWFWFWLWAVSARVFFVWLDLDVGLPLR